MNPLFSLLTVWLLLGVLLTTGARLFVELENAAAIYRADRDEEHDVRACIQCTGNGPRAQVHIREHQLIANRVDGRASVQVVQCLAKLLQSIQVGKHIVTGDHRDAGAPALGLKQLLNIFHQMDQSLF